MVYERKAEDWGMSLHYDVCLQKIKLKNNFLDFYDVSLVKFVILFSCVCLSQERAKRDSIAEAGVHGPDASESLSPQACHSLGHAGCQDAVLEGSGMFQNRTGRKS